jgi:hypothetical protein
MVFAVDPSSVPQPRRVTAAGGGEQLSIRAERHAGDRIAVADIMDCGTRSRPCTRTWAAACATCRTRWATRTRGPPAAMTGPATRWTGRRGTRSPPTWPPRPGQPLSPGRRPQPSPAGPPVRVLLFAAAGNSAPPAALSSPPSPAAGRRGPPDGAVELVCPAFSRFGSLALALRAPGLRTSGETASAGPGWARPGGGAAAPRSDRKAATPTLARARRPGPPHPGTGPR